jgi:hypothetical protein
VFLLLYDGLCAVTKQGAIHVVHWNPWADQGSPDQYGDQPFNPRCPFDLTVRSTAFMASFGQQKAGAISLWNGPDLNAEFDSCTFAFNNASARVSSFSSIRLCRAQPELCVCVC